MKVNRGGIPLPGRYCREWVLDYNNTQHWQLILQDFTRNISLKFSQDTNITFALSFNLQPQSHSQLGRGGLSSLHLVCQQVLKVHPFCKVACISISEITQKNLLHILHTIFDKGQRKHFLGQKLNFCLVDYREGFPTVSHCADMWGRAHLSQSDLWMATGPDVDLSTLAAWREADACVSKGGAERCSTMGDSPFLHQ